MPARHGDSRDHQLPADGADAAVRGAHSSNQRSPRDCRQLSAVSCSLVQFELFNADLKKKKKCFQPNTALLCAFSVIIHIVSRCHEEGLEHYLRSFVKVRHKRRCRGCEVKLIPLAQRERNDLLASFSLKCIFFSLLSTCSWPTAPRQETQRPLTRCWPPLWRPPSSKLLISTPAINCSRCVCALCLFVTGPGSVQV